jgi:hypothetical protein
MVLNNSEQRNLFSMLENGVGGRSGEVVFRIQGSELVGTLNNYNRKFR